MAADQTEPVELQRIGCSLASSAIEFVDALKPRLSKTGKYNDRLDGLAELMVENWGVFTVAQVRDKGTYEHWEQAFTQTGLPTAWIETIGRALGVELVAASSYGRPAGTPASASLAMLETVELPMDVIKQARFSGLNNLGKRLEAIGQLDGVRLPQKIFDAITECPDYKRLSITYNDFKAVLSEIFKWTFATFGTVHIDRLFARHLEKELIKNKVFLPANRSSWSSCILDRFENGRRTKAEVRRAVPTPESNLDPRMRASMCP